MIENTNQLEIYYRLYQYCLSKLNQFSRYLVEHKNNIIVKLLANMILNHLFIDLYYYLNPTITSKFCERCIKILCYILGLSFWIYIVLLITTYDKYCYIWNICDNHQTKYNIKYLIIGYSVICYSVILMGQFLAIERLEAERKKADDERKKAGEERKKLQDSIDKLNLVIEEKNAPTYTEFRKKIYSQCKEEFIIDISTMIGSKYKLEEPYEPLDLHD